MFENMSESKRMWVVNTGWIRRLFDLIYAPVFIVGLRIA